VRYRTLAIALCLLVEFAGAAYAVKISQPSGGSFNPAAPGELGAGTSSPGHFTKLCTGASPCTNPTNTGDVNFDGILTFPDVSANDCYNAGTYSICAPAGTSRLTLQVPAGKSIVLAETNDTEGQTDPATGSWKASNHLIIQSDNPATSMARLPFTLPIAATAATTTTQWGEQKVVKAITVENAVFTVGQFTCSVNPALSVFDCSATAGTCTPVATLATSGTLTGIGATDAATTPTANVAAGEYLALKFTAGTCTVFNGSATLMARPQ